MASGRPATKECHRCHHRFPVTRMEKSTIEVQTGRSGSSVAFNSSFKSGRVYSGRKYYRKKVVWTCDECRAKDGEAAKLGGKLLLWLFGIGLAVVLVGKLVE